jgi:hypothetical protein
MIFHEPNMNIVHEASAWQKMAGLAGVKKRYVYIVENR